MPRVYHSTRVADFETTTNENDCRVWCWGSRDIYSGDYKTGTDIESFIDYCCNISSVTYFHNLAFDASFIIDYLLKNGYKWTPKHPKPGEFTSLISMLGKFYSVTLNTFNGVKTEFRDSLKKLPLSVEQLAKSFNLEIRKLEIDYDLPHPVGYTPTEQEWDYLKNDIDIVAEALKITLEEGHNRLTIGSDTLNDFKQMIGGREWRTLFPTISLEVDADLREAYRGGFTYADPRFKQRLLGPGNVYDVNSLYPYVMQSKELPFGTPRYYPDGPAEDSHYITSITFTAKIKKNHIPVIQIKKSPLFSPTMYQTEIPEPVTLACTDVDLAMWRKHYDLEILSYNGTYHFDSATGIFDDYVNKWATVKENSEGGIRLIAKLFLNSLYGKFATNPNITGKYPVLEGDTVKLRTGKNETRNPVYTPVGIFVTAWARNHTISVAQKYYNQFAYADTDSVHLIGEPPEDLDIHPTRFGAWKHEGKFSRAVYVRAKQYGETFNDSDIIHIAGLPKHLSEKIDVKDLLTDHVWAGKLIPVRTPGGIVLRETNFTFKARG